MRKKLALVAATMLVTGTGVIAALSTSSSASVPSPTTSITVIEHAVSDHVTDIGKPGDSAGDLLTWHNRVYDDTDASVVGRDQGICTRISPKKGSWECVWTTFLADGQITVEGPFYDAADSVVAVTGGTGSYANAAGSMALHCYTGDDGVGRCDFAFTLS